jgi:Tol biopolymer transport system component/DNA-binding winged helix-turn-helix (wHTH) protein
MSQISVVPHAARARFRFGVFFLDGKTSELRKSGIRIRIQSQPLQVLLYLAERAGEVVTREELQRHCWPPDSTVDVDRSLASAIHKIRECLDDSVTSPRFIETLTRTGYRFIAPIAEVVDEDAPAGASRSTSSLRSLNIPVISMSEELHAGEEISPLTEPAGSKPVHAPDAAPLEKTAAKQGLAAYFSLGRLPIWLVIALATLAGLALGQFRRPNRVWMPAVERLTQSGGADFATITTEGYPGAVSDGSRIYFPGSISGKRILAEVLLTGGEATQVVLPNDLGAPYPDDVSPDGFQLLLRNHLSAAAEQPLWIASTAGQSVRQIPGVLAHDGTWMPDGKGIMYANGDQIYQIRENGSDNSKWASLPGRAFRMRFSPDGSRVRLTLVNDRTHDASLWEVDADGTNAHKILSNWNPLQAVCCGSWTQDGNLYVFQAGDGPGATLWAMRSSDGLFGGHAEPFPLLQGPMSYFSPITSREGNRVFFTGTEFESELMQVGATRGSITHAPEFLRDASRVESTRDGLWVAWIRSVDGSLWRSQSDGSNRVRVLGAPFRVSGMRWSPDGSQLALTARKPGSPWKIYLQDARSGHTEPLLTEDHNEADADWTPDGQNIVFGRPPARVAEASLPRALYSVRVSTRQVRQLPGNPDLLSSRVSRDGSKIVALSQDQTSLVLLDVASGSWSTLLHGHFEAPEWSPDGMWIYFLDFAEDGRPIKRVNARTVQVEQVLSGRDVQSGRVHELEFAGMLPNGMPAVSVCTSAAAMYGMNLPPADSR